MRFSDNAGVHYCDLQRTSAGQSLLWPTGGSLVLLHTGSQFCVTLRRWPSLGVEVQLNCGLQFHIASLRHVKFVGPSEVVKARQT